MKRYYPLVGVALLFLFLFYLDTGRGGAFFRLSESHFRRLFRRPEIREVFHLDEEEARAVFGPWEETYV